MSDYISREAFIADCEGRYCAPCKEQGKEANGVRCRACWVDDMLSEVLDAPTADVAPVVPCKGCEHAERYARTDGTAGYYCGHPQNTFVYGERWDRVFKPVKKPDDFCSFGEPRGAKK